MVAVIDLTGLACIEKRIRRDGARRTELSSIATVVLTKSCLGSRFI